MRWLENYDDTVSRMSRGIAFLDHMNVPPGITAGPYTVRFAQTLGEIHAAQALRYRIFYQEKCGQPNDEMRSLKRDVDEWDEGGFHIIVLDQSKDSQSQVVGTLRLFYSECLAQQQCFYTEKTFDLSRLKRHFDSLLELSRVDRKSVV